jgi:hypothetical protein
MDSLKNSFGVGRVRRNISGPVFLTGPSIEFLFTIACFFDAYLIKVVPYL